MIAIIVTIILVMGIYSYQKDKPNKKAIIPVDLEEILESNVLFYQKLEKKEKELFRVKVKTFLKEVYIDAVGFELETLDIVLVAASAIIPVFYFDTWQYRNLSSVIIYPDNFNSDLMYRGDNRVVAGMIGSGRYENQMILSRKALHHGFKNNTDKSNTAIHEFVHLIDKSDGIVDGVPSALLTNAYVIPWLKLIHQEMESINNDTSDIRGYGGTNQQEFFAVAAEYFFERPDLLKRKHPELFKMMEMCFCNTKK
ncbi:M90 family metallopeptidase [Wenyingzhuangia gilva]